MIIKISTGKLRNIIDLAIGEEIKVFMGPGENSHAYIDEDSFDDVKDTIIEMAIEGRRRNNGKQNRACSKGKYPFR